MVRFALLLALSIASAQAQTAGVSIQQAADLIDEAGAMAGLTAAEALAATVLSPAGGTNVVVLVQDGDFNEAQVEQQGTGNRFALVQQGDFHRTTAQIIGHANTTTVTQRGAGHEYDLLMVTDAVDLLPVVQEGEGNRAVQFVAPGLLPAGIEQRGNGMEIIIERVQR